MVVVRPRPPTVCGFRLFTINMYKSIIMASGRAAKGGRSSALRQASYGKEPLHGWKDLLKAGLKRGKLLFDNPVARKVGRHSCGEPSEWAWYRQMTPLAIQTQHCWLARG